MTQRSAAMFVVLLAAAFCTAAMADPIPMDPGVTLRNGGHSTDIFGFATAPYFPFADAFGAEPVADCIIQTDGSAECSFRNANPVVDQPKFVFGQIDVTIPGTNPSLLTCTNAINPAAGCQVQGDTILFFGLGIPPGGPEDPPDLSLFSLIYDPGFNPPGTLSPGITSDLLALSILSVPEPASAFLVGTGLAALGLTLRRNLRRRKAQSASIQRT
jgi:hypothetical protein